jgi:mono/diheme cytochrome c family protein
MVVQWRATRVALAMAVSAGMLAVAGAGRAQDVTFTPEFLKSPQTIEMGRKVWRERCVFCHGKDAYPGKGPRLSPSKYTAEFVYDRVTNGFRGMPPWKDYDDEQRKAVAAFVLSPEFGSQ